MGKADSLSKKSDWKKKGEKDNEERVLLKTEQLKIRMGKVIVEGVDVLEKIRKSDTKDDEVIKAVEEMKKTGVKILRDEEQREEDGIMLKKEKVYMPRDEALKGAKRKFSCDQQVERGSDSSQLYAKEFIGRKKKWGYQKEIKI